MRAEQLLADRREPCCVAGGQHDPSALGQEPAHRGEADPAATADDERDLAVEPGWQVG